MSDIYEDLKKATPEELLEVAKSWYLWTCVNSEGECTINREYLMDVAFFIGRGDGWGQIAPAWFVQYQADKKAEKNRLDDFALKCKKHLEGKPQ